MIPWTVWIYYQKPFCYSITIPKDHVWFIVERLWSNFTAICRLQHFWKVVHQGHLLGCQSFREAQRVSNMIVVQSRASLLSSFHDIFTNNLLVLHSYFFYVHKFSFNIFIFNYNTFSKFSFLRGFGNASIEGSFHRWKMMEPTAGILRSLKTKFRPSLITMALATSKNYLTKVAYFIFFLFT